MEYLYQGFFLGTVDHYTFYFYSKQDVFVGFATVPGFVSLTSTEGSPYLQELGIECIIEKVEYFICSGLGHTTI